MSHFAAELSNWFWARMIRCWSMMPPGAAALSPACFSLRRAARAVEDWLERAADYCDTPDGAYWWQKSFALLAYPLMPRLGESLWQELGHNHQPTMTAFLDQPSPHRRDVERVHIQISRWEILAAIAA
ncbi:hypothetical protein [Phyllobacterium leguminum]|uniref:hypothetical protein n=1 Tax=Phyllobacterium leguminum TaxID=314237 RepID=UPI0015E8A0B1|nr:hypothetical protein [Phyllobacterium leguminum]